MTVEWPHPSCGKWHLTHTHTHTNIHLIWNLRSEITVVMKMRSARNHTIFPLTFPAPSYLVFSFIFNGVYTFTLAACWNAHKMSGCPSYLLPASGGLIKHRVVYTVLLLIYLFIIILFSSLLGRLEKDLWPFHFKMYKIPPPPASLNVAFTNWSSSPGCKYSLPKSPALQQRDIGIPHWNSRENLIWIELPLAL
jgi:hypothetical protein